MNKMEITKEFNKIKEISEAIIQAEYIVEIFPIGDDTIENYLDVLKFKCLKYDLCEVDELEKLSKSKKELSFKFCGELKQYLFSEFVENISDNTIETDKYFRDFYEVYKGIIILETGIDKFGSFHWEWEGKLNKLKFVCLKHKLYEPVELENIKKTDDPEALLKFCEELKENISNEFLEKVLRE